MIPQKPSDPRNILRLPAVQKLVQTSPPGDGIGLPGRGQRVGLGKIEGFPRGQPSILPGVPLQVAAAQIELPLNGITVADGPVGSNLPCDPPAPRGLQHPDFIGVHHHIRVFIPPLKQPAGISPLPVLLQQAGDNFYRLSGGSPPFQSQAQQVHSKKPGLSFAALIPASLSLVSDRHAPLIHPHLKSPDPVRSRSQNAVGMGDLRDGDIGALHRFAVPVILRRKPDERLRLPQGPVAVFCHSIAALRAKPRCYRKGVA